MDTQLEAAAKFKALVECNLEAADFDAIVDLTNPALVRDALLGWDEYNYGGKYREYQREVADAIVALALKA